MLNPPEVTESSVTNLMYKVFPVLVNDGGGILPQNFPNNGEAALSPSLISR